MSSAFLEAAQARCSGVPELSLVAAVVLFLTGLAASTTLDAAAVDDDATSVTGLFCFGAMVDVVENGVQTTKHEGRDAEKQGQNNV